MGPGIFFFEEKEISKKCCLTPTIPGKAATFAICLTPGRNPPIPKKGKNNKFSRLFCFKTCLFSQVLELFSLLTKSYGVTSNKMLSAILSYGTISK